MTDPAELARRLRDLRIGLNSPLIKEAAALIETQARELAEARAEIARLRT